MRHARLMFGIALCACAGLISAEASAESAVLICMWPDGRPTKVAINYDARIVIWAGSNSAPARITNDEIAWEVPGEASFSLNRRSSKIRITGWGGLRNVTNSYPCTKTAP